MDRYISESNGKRFWYFDCLTIELKNTNELFATTVVLFVTFERNPKTLTQTKFELSIEGKRRVKKT